MIALGEMLFHETFIMHVEVAKYKKRRTLARILYSKNNIEIIKRYNIHEKHIS